VLFRSSLFDAKQNPPAILLEKTEIARGEKLEMDLSPFRNAQVLRLEYIDISGNTLTRRTKIIVVDGEKPVELLRFALSDQPGKWTLRLTDVATGLSSKTAVDVK